MAKIAIQGGVDNYLGKQPQVQAPRKWQSAPDKPSTELAYITEAEKNLILKANIHGGLEGGPNMGPSGIMSLDSFGDAGGGGAGGADTDTGGGYDTGSGGGGFTGDGGNNNYTPPTTKLPPAVQKAVDEGKKTSVVTKEDEKKAAADAKAFQNKLKIQAKKKAKEKLNLKISSNKDLRLYDKNKDGVLNFFERHAKRRNESRKKTAAKRSLKTFERLEDFLEFDDYSLDGIAAAKARGYKVDGDILGNAGSVNFTGYDSNPLTNPDAINPSLGYDFTRDKDGNKINKGMETLTSNRGTSIEKTRPNLYPINTKVPFSLVSEIFGKVRPNTQVTLQNTLDQAALYNQLAGKDLTTQEDLKEIGNRGRTEEQIRFLENPPNTGSENILPYPYNQDDDDTEEDEQEVDYTQRVIYDDYGKPGYRTTRAAEGGIMGTRARRAMGGIMERVDKRQQFFLGGIGKAIKGVVGGVVDATKKVFKSDLGRYAIMAAGMYYGGGGASMFKSGGLKGMAGNFMSTKNPLLFTDGALSLSKLAGISGVLPFLAGEAKPNKGNFSDRGGQLIDPLTGEEATPAEMRESIELAKLEAGNDPDKLAAIDAKYNNMLNLQYQAGLPDATPYLGYGESGYRTTAATGGRIGKAEGGLLDLGGMEKDYRAEGGFVPIGEYEKKDDVPARLSVNEFVMTADAVRGAGQGDIDKGAEIMENMMKNLENGGTVSEESQGNKGAQNMFKTSERLGAII